MEEISLKEHLEVKIESLKIIIDEKDKLYDTRFKASEVAVNAALAAQEKAVTAAFSASEKAIVKAEDAQKDYNVRSNEFRGQLDDQAKTLMPRAETMAVIKGIEDRIEAQRLANEKTHEGLSDEIAGLRESRAEGSGSKTGIKDFWGYIVGAIGLALALYNFLT